MAQSSVASKTYASRVASFANPAAKLLLETMERKKTNLCVSVDVTKKADLLQVVESVGADVCMVKTHIDIVEDFDLDLTEKLSALSTQHDFMIFEDRKFADIGNTVSLQYSSGVHKIASWSHITNAHLVPGPGIITGLAEVGQPLGRGLLLLAEMSSKGNLAGGEYGQKCVQAARDDTTGFTCGFIAMDRIDEKVALQPGQEHKDFLVLTPGVGLDAKGDGKGQQYRTPDEVIRQSGCDVIIVGRGIYGALLKDGDKSEAFRNVKEQAARYRKAGWEAYLQRTQQNLREGSSKRGASPLMTPPRKRRLFAPKPAVTDGDAALALQLSQERASNANGVGATRSYSLRRRTQDAVQVKSEESEDVVAEEVEALTASTSGTRSTATSRKSRSSGVPKQEDEDDEKKPAIKREKPSPFDVSPQKKTAKPIKLELDPSEIKPAPKRWRAQLDVLQKQRKRIVAPVDEMGCEENGREDRRADAWRVTAEDEEDRAKRDRLTVLISLMLSSQTKDEVTAQAVKNLQTNLVDGISLASILASTDEQISSCIAKVGFWRRKTGYIKSAASILQSTFGGDVPKDIDELCSLPGVGPKMAFLTLQSAWKLNLGIGVDVHVHRLANRLGWCKTNDPEGTRLVLQSFLPKDLHHSINKTLVGFGQVVCVPVGPRCDLCDLGKARLCPSYRKVDPKSAATRKQVILLPDSDEEGEEGKTEKGAEGATPAVEVAIEGPDGVGKIEVKVED